MSNQGFTPGPWELELGRDNAPRGLRGPAEVEHRNIINWNGFSSPTKPASMANARLIAAAPDLLEALTQCRAELLAMIDKHNQQDSNDGSWLYDYQTVVEADAAIAKTRSQ